MVCTTRVGYWPVAVSPLSITASAPSSTALATSVTSLRFGLVRSIMLSLHHLRSNDRRFGLWIHLRMMSFWIADLSFNRNFNTGVSAGNHHAITFNNDIAEIFQRFRHFDLGDHFILLLLARMIFFSSAISATLRTPQSTRCVRMNSRSFRSFKPRSHGKITVGKVYSCAWIQNSPPSVTFTFTFFVQYFTTQHFHFAIVEEDAFAHFYIGAQVGMKHISSVQCQALFGCENKFITCFSMLLFHRPRSPTFSLAPADQQASVEILYGSVLLILVMWSSLSFCLHVNRERNSAWKHYTCFTRSTSKAVGRGKVLR